MIMLLSLGFVAETYPGRATGANCTAPALSASSRLQGLLHRLRCAFDHQQVSPGRSLRLAGPLFPMAQRVDAEPEPAGEFLLRHLQTHPDRPHVDLLGHMHAIGARVRLPPCIGRRLLQATTDTVSNLAHGLLLLNVSTSSAVSRRKSLRSCWLRSARSFLAKAVSAKSGISAPW